MAQSMLCVFHGATRHRFFSSTMASESRLFMQTANTLPVHCFGLAFVQVTHNARVKNARFQGIIVYGWVLHAVFAGLRASGRDFRFVTHGNLIIYSLLCLQPNLICLASPAK
jgi:hypothetical protein